MMKIKRAVLMAVLVVPVAALAVPLVGLNARATGFATVTNGAAATQQDSMEVGGFSQESAGQIFAGTLKAKGIQHSEDSDARAKLAEAFARKKPCGGGITQYVEPMALNPKSAWSAALLETIGGRDDQFSEMILIADWDAHVDCEGDLEQKVDSFSFVEADMDVSLSRTCVGPQLVNQRALIKEGQKLECPELGLILLVRRIDHDSLANSNLKEPTGIARTSFMPRVGAFDFFDPSGDQSLRDPNSICIFRLRNVCDGIGKGRLFTASHQARSIKGPKPNFDIISHFSILDWDDREEPPPIKVMDITYGSRGVETACAFNLNCIAQSFSDWGKEIELG